MATDIAAILSRLESIQQDLSVLTERVLGEDSLTAGDRRAIREANAAFDTGLTTRLASLPTDEGVMSVSLRALPRGPPHSRRRAAVQLAKQRCTASIRSEGRSPIALRVSPWRPLRETLRPLRRWLRCGLERGDSPWPADSPPISRLSAPSIARPFSEHALSEVLAMLYSLSVIHTKTRQPLVRAATAVLRTGSRTPRRDGYAANTPPGGSSRPTTCHGKPSHQATQGNWFAAAVWRPQR